MENQNYLVKFIIENKIFKRNKKDLELKIYALLLAFQGISVRKTSRGLNKLISKSAVHYNLMNAKQKLYELMNRERKERKYIAIDETKIKMNGKQYYIYSAIDVERNEITAMKAFVTRGYLTTPLFIKEVMKACRNKDFIVLTDGLPFYKQVCDKLGLRHCYEKFGKRSSVESCFSSLKQQSRRFFNNVNVVFRKWIKRLDRSLIMRRCLYLLDLFCVQFVVYYNYLRR